MKSFLPWGGFLLLFLAGCEADLDTVYGQRSGPGADKSVNGTAVLGDMFERAGHHVYSWRRLSPRLEQHADCIVWFPDDFQPPSPKVIAWFDRWLKAQRGRTLIYVGRDFDAAPGYWRSIQSLAPADQQAVIGRRLTVAEQSYQADRKKSLKEDTTEWFSLEEGKPQQVRRLAGARRWITGVDATQGAVELQRRMTPELRAEMLLDSDGEMLVARATTGFQGSRLILVANGSFLLNFPLVNHEHRKLAGRLIEEIGPARKEVAFLESDAGGPLIDNRDPAAQSPTGLELLCVWPTNWILMHLAAAGVIFCFARWPIFGMPRQPDGERLSDFGKHVDALAEILKRSRDRAYALTRIQQYRQSDAMKKRDLADPQTPTVK